MGLTEAERYLVYGLLTFRNYEKRSMRHRKKILKINFLFFLHFFDCCASASTVSIFSRILFAILHEKPVNKKRRHCCSFI